MTALPIPVSRTVPPSGHADACGRAHWPLSAIVLTRLVGAWAIAVLAVLAATVAIPCAAADTDLISRGREIESYLEGFPKRALPELEGLLPQARAAGASTRHFIESLYGLAMVKANRTAERPATTTWSQWPGSFAARSSRGTAK